uniref:Uncharacterized protein n=1 Tax=Hemiselmis tepida TaxID=464990 RepID=A0A6T6VZC3_9CRYP
MSYILSISWSHVDFYGTEHLSFIDPFFLSSLLKVLFVSCWEVFATSLLRRRETGVLPRCGPYLRHWLQAQQTALIARNLIINRIGAKLLRQPMLRSSRINHGRLGQWWLMGRVDTRRIFRTIKNEVARSWRRG